MFGSLIEVEPKGPKGRAGQRTKHCTLSSERREGLSGERSTAFFEVVATMISISRRQPAVASPMGPLHFRLSSLRWLVGGVRCAGVAVVKCQLPAHFTTLPESIFEFKSFEAFAGSR